MGVEEDVEPLQIVISIGVPLRTTRVTVITRVEIGGSSDV